MSKILIFAAGVAVVFAITSSADARAVRHYTPQGFYGYHGYAPWYYGYAPRFLESPVNAPDAPPPRYYNNPGVPDFQLGSRG